MTDARWKLRLTSPSARALYCHLPFCEKKCAYCDFASWATKRQDPLMTAYVIGLQHLIEQAASVGLLQETTTAYLGGGTPSMVGTPLSWLCETINCHAALQELSIEANPESLTKPLVDELLSQNVTRFSLGVQSLNDRELLRLGRIHDSKRALAALKLAVASGAHVSADLMCGIPLQTQASWQNSLDRLLATGISHISVYPLMVEEGTALALSVQRGEESDPDPDFQANLMELAEKNLNAAGFERYEVASYAQAGAACKHNLSYWSGQPYLGVGTSAAGMLTRSGWERLRLLAPQLPTAPQNCVRVRYNIASTRKEIASDTGWNGLNIHGEFLTARQATAEDLMLAARKSEGISAAQYAYAQTQLGTEFVECIQRLVERELLAPVYTCPGQNQGKSQNQTSTKHQAQVQVQLECCQQPNAQVLPECYVPTHQGWLLGNELYGELWDLAQSEVQTFLSARVYACGLMCVLS